MVIKNVLLIGGSGFLGSAVAARLATAGMSLRVPSRRPERARHLLTLPAMELIQADVHDPATLAGLMQGQDAVVSLVGVLHSRPGSPYGPDFARAHVDLPAKIVAACAGAGVRRLVHVSALGADPAGPSAYQRSKAAGEAAIRAAGPGLAWTLLRPSVIFGRGDHFLNLFAGLLRLFPLLPLAGAATRFQPVWVGDVAEVVARCLTGPGVAGQTYPLAGPKVYALADLVRYVGRLTGHRRPVLALPEALGMVQARLLELAPNPVMSRDNLLSMRVDNVVAEGTPPLPFGLAPHPLEAVAPLYLGAADPRGRYYAFRQHHHPKAG
jgi:NADH dehydrogenase